MVFEAQICFGERGYCMKNGKNMSKIMRVMMFSLVISVAIISMRMDIFADEMCFMVTGEIYEATEMEMFAENVLANADVVQYCLDDVVDTPYVMASTLMSEDECDGITYRTYEETLIVLRSTLPGAYSASGQKYGIAAANTVSITWSSTNFQTAENLKVKFNSMSAKYTELSGVSTAVTKMEYSASLQPQYGTYEYLAMNSVTNPVNGVSYGKTLNSGYYNFGAQTLVAMIKLYYANGDVSEYSGSPSINH